MISSQLGVEFTNKSSDLKQYANIKKVYSIWICSNTAEYKANSVERYNINRSFLIGENRDTPRYDLLEVLIINIGNKHKMNDSGSNMLTMLNGLLDVNASGKARLKTLTDCGVRVTNEIKKEVEDMKDQFYEAMENAIAKGLAQGLAQGLEQGMERGKELGLIEVAINMIKAGFSKEDILKTTSEDIYNKALAQLNN